MADMKDALRKAGLVSQRQVRQAEHAGRVHRTDVGAEGLAAEQERRESEQQAELEHKKSSDQAREHELQVQREQEARHARVEALLREGNLMAREGGPKRFYFTHPTGQIYFLDVSPGLARRLQMGDAAIVDAAGVLSSDFIAVPGKTAHELRLVERERILHWNVRS
jgi:uncharacterized protein YaiL (DUF2058 family)